MQAINDKRPMALLSMLYLTVAGAQVRKQQWLSGRLADLRSRLTSTQLSSHGLSTNLPDSHDQSDGYSRQYRSCGAEHCARECSK